MKSLETMKLVDVVRDLDHEKGYSWEDSSRRGWLTLATILACGFEKGLGINQMQADIDLLTEKYQKELNALLKAESE